MQLPAPAAEMEPSQGVQLFAVPTVEAWLTAPHTYAVEEVPAAHWPQAACESCEAPGPPPLAAWELQKPAPHALQEPASVPAFVPAGQVVQALVEPTVESCIPEFAGS